MKHVHIINAHQFYEGVSEGTLTRTLADITKTFCEEKGYSYSMTHIEEGYIPEEEVDLYVKADYVVLHTPVYWFNTPWIHKKYVDEVFNTGLATGKLLKDDGRTRRDPSKNYGTGGLMQGRKMTMVTSWNAPEEFSGNGNQYLLSGKTADDVMYNVGVNYRFCGFEVLPQYHCFNVIKDPQVEKYMSGYRQHLEIHLV
jgi:modulator of drug activity B